MTAATSCMGLAMNKIHLLPTTSSLFAFCISHVRSGNLINFQSEFPLSLSLQCMNSLKLLMFCVWLGVVFVTPTQSQTHARVSYGRS
jgi:hypothetical protein